MTKFLKALEKIEDWVCIISLLAMTLLVFANVISRYVFHASMSFSEEITTNLFVLLSMFGTAIATRNRSHLGLTILTDAVNFKARKTLLVFGYGLGTVLSAALFYYGIKMVGYQLMLGQVTAAMQWPEWIYGSFIPLGAVFMTIRFAQCTYEELYADEAALKSEAEILIENAKNAAKEDK